MKTNHWFALLAATTALGVTAPVGAGNGATILFLIAATLTLINNPITRDYLARKDTQTWEHNIHSLEPLAHSTEGSHTQHTQS